MATFKRKVFADHSGGAQCKTANALLGRNQVRHAMNADFDEKIGGIVGRRGSERKSVVSADKQLLQLYVYKNDALKKYVAAAPDATNRDIYVNAEENFSGTWSKSKENLGTSALPRFRNFATKLVMCDGVNNPQWYNGTTWSAITNAPSAGKFPEVYNQRLYILDEDSFLHYSDVINSSGDGLTTTSWLDRGIHPNDGQTGKMLIRYRGRLIIFKEESIYRYDGTNEPEPIIEIGTHSSESVVRGKYVYFHHPTGIYRIGSGDPQLISRPVQKFLDGMSSDNWENVASGKDRFGNIYFWIGDVTINDPFSHDFNTTYSDLVLVYNEYSESWTTYSGWNARTWYFDNLEGKTYFGTEAGKIFEIRVGYSDVDDTTINQINFDVVFGGIDYGYPELEKDFGKIIIKGRNGLNLKVGADYNQMENVDFFERVGVFNKGFIAKELWFGVNQTYKDTPPMLEKMIFDEVKLYQDEL